MLATSIPRSLALLAALLLAACKTVPITPKTISGRYEMPGHPQGTWYSGEALVLGEGTFQYWLYTNGADTRYPVSGTYTLKGPTITFHNPAVLNPVRTIMRDHKQFVLWTPKQREIYRDTRYPPEDLLIQKIL